MLGAFDTAVFVPRRGLYVFAGDQVWRYSNSGRAPDEGFPRPITAELPGTFARNLDAALVHPDGSLHLFRGDQHIRYDVGRRRPELGYPRRYAGDWPGVFPQRIDAALTWAPDIVYVFSGDHYTSFSPRRSQVRGGYPKLIARNWPGFDGGRVHAALALPDDRRVLVGQTQARSYDRDGYPHEHELELPIPAAAARSANAVPGEAALLSRRFQGSPARTDLEAIAAGKLRLGRRGDPEYPAPIRSTGPVVREVQAALIELGCRLAHGADGSFGNETYAAVLGYKRKHNIRTASGYLDGIVGPDTIRHVDAALPLPPCPLPGTEALAGSPTTRLIPGIHCAPQVLPTTTFRLCVDAERNGKLVPAPTTWQWGSTGKGAILLVNNDDDGDNHHPDNEDKVVNIGNDIGDVASLMVERTSSGSVPKGTKLELSVSDKDRIRIFASRTPGGKEIIGPTAGSSHEFKDLTSKQIMLGMEAVRYAGSGFTGEVTITLKWTGPLGTVSTETTVVRAAPWVVFNHLDEAEKVFVVDAQAFSNLRFRNELRAHVVAAGCTLAEFKSGDIWMQDCLEFGHARLPGTTLRTVQRAPRDRPLQAFPRTLLAADFGFVAEGTLADITFNSTGNLEATPPVTSAAGKRYPLGRIYYGPGRPLEPMDPDVRAFLRSQIVQDPIELETGWLAVGHVDEVISFVPSNRPKGFAMLLASPKRAWDILDGLILTHAGANKILVGRRFPIERPDRTIGTVPVEQTIAAFVNLKDEVNPQLKITIAAHIVAYTPGTLRDYNTARQANIDVIRAKMKAELGLDESDIVDVPAVFMPTAFTPPQADALIAGMVNMLVINRHCIVPKPFGPVVGGVDKFEEELSGKLTPLGLTVKFLDCWDEYHVNLGEIHCATNALRKPPSAKWWEFQP